MQTKNEVLVVGKIISRREGKTKDYITVFTRNGRKEVFAKFTCEKGMLLPDLSRVKIKGHIERPTRRRGNNFISEQILIADSISPLKTLTESAFGVKGKFFPDAEAKAYFCGNIKNVSKTNDWMRYNINVDKKTITVGMKEIDRMPDIKEGDEVCCVCGISTPRKEVEGDVHYFLDLVVLDIAKVTE